MPFLTQNGGQLASNALGPGMASTDASAENPLLSWAKDGLFFCDSYVVTRVPRLLSDVAFDVLEK